MLWYGSRRIYISLLCRQVYNMAVPTLFNIQINYQKPGAILTKAFHFHKMVTGLYESGNLDLHRTTIRNQTLLEHLQRQLTDQFWNSGLYEPNKLLGEMQRTATVSSKFGTKNVTMLTRKEMITEFLYSRNILIQSQYSYEVTFNPLNEYMQGY